MLCASFYLLQNITGMSTELAVLKAENNTLHEARHEAKDKEAKLEKKLEDQAREMHQQMKEAQGAKGYVYRTS
jgi:hypothetical protein